jgi:hypothetical protein
MTGSKDASHDADKNRSSKTSTFKRLARGDGRRSEYDVKDIGECGYIHKRMFA